MTWLDLAAATAVAVALVFVPGLALTFAAGLRGLWVAALATPAGVTVIGVAAVASPMMGQGWSVSSVAIVTVVAAVVLFALRALVWRRQPADSTLRGRGVFVFAAVAIAVAVTTVQLVLMIGAPDSISQTFDNVFHLNAVRYILDHGNASPLFVASMTSAGAPASFYPTGWHAIASLVVMISGVTIPVASHATMLVFAAVAWPLGIVLFTRTLGVHSRAGLLVAGVAAASFPSFPLLAVDYGVLFPYMMGLSLIPASLAAVLSLRFATTLPERARWLVILLGVVPGMAIAHPGGLMAFLLFGAVILALGVISHLMSDASRRSKGAVSVVAGIGVVVFCAIWYVMRPEAAARTWLPDETVAQAIGEVLAASPARSALNIAMAVLVVTGIVVCIRRRTRTDLVALAIAFVASALYIVVSGLPYWTLRDMIVGVWYDNSPRLAALLPIIWVPLAARGYETAHAWLRELLTKRGVNARSARWIVAASSALIIGVLPQATAMRVAVDNAARSYRFTDAAPLLSSDEYELIMRLPGLVPRDAVIAGSPWTGTALAYALADRNVLMPHTLTATTPDTDLINEDLDDASPGSPVCNAIRTEHVQYVLDFGSREVNGGRHVFPGLKDLRDSPAVRLVDEVGEARLYEVVGCDS
ncbi:DUF6541 family protein [uncultured Microbacterium sp.]|uniref:DUF6541 family protein n=1 Tax=uncultured Microbacterium sp. TaxID=191216 RepID=UPI0025CF246D|nr:DUF6541 family protein [uncultured Microbacterium sp.]